MRSNSSIWAAVLFIAAFSWACGGRPKNMIKVDKGLNENFIFFYERFHADADFQRSRIKFPLEGFRVEDGKNYKWSKKNWEIMRTRIDQVDQSMFKTSKNFDGKNFVQKVWVEGSDFVSEYRFEVIGKKWYLVYAYEQFQ